MKESNLTLDKLPPQNIEAEQSVLGAILLDNNALYTAFELITPDDFYKDSNKRIFIAMTELLEKNEPIDIITLSDHLRKKDNLDAIGWTQYLTSLASMIPTSANVRFHSKIVREKSMVRGLLRSVTDIARNVYETEQDAEELIDYAEKTIFDLSERRISPSFSILKDVIKDSFQMIEQLYDKKETVTGVPSGFKALDELTTGLQKSDLIIIGGRPSMGKTAFSLNIAQHVGVNMKEPVAVFSLEMSKEQLAFRMLCSEAMVDSNNIRKGFIRKDDWHKLTSAAGKLAESPIFIDDSSAISVLEMRAKARRLKVEHGLSLIIVDYLQLMRGRGNAERREQEISEISRSLKGLAKELRVPVIALSQLNRGVETRTGNKKPTLADLRESGAIEQDADVIIFLYRDEVYNRDSNDNKGKAEIIIAKQRNGPTGTIPLSFISHCTRFVDYSDREYHDIDEAF
ncbi:MAG TPA: replicative DNA helicase [Thermodesulfovibrionales bacterium]|nr:replicative DNA helicase [Thermodesulfovibrionales bacterium]